MVVFLRSRLLKSWVKLLGINSALIERENLGGSNLDDFPGTLSMTRPLLLNEAIEPSMLGSELLTAPQLSLVLSATWLDRLFDPSGVMTAVVDILRLPVTCSYND